MKCSQRKDSRTYEDRAKEALKLLDKYSKPIMAFVLASYLDSDAGFMRGINKIMLETLNELPRLKRENLEFIAINSEDLKEAGDE